MSTTKYNITCPHCRWFGARHELRDGERCPQCKAALATYDAGETAQRVAAMFRDAMRRAKLTPWAVEHGTNHSLEDGRSRWWREYIDRIAAMGHGIDFGNWTWTLPDNNGISVLTKREGADNEQQPTTPNSIPN